MFCVRVKGRCRPARLHRRGTKSASKHFGRGVSSCCPLGKTKQMRKSNNMSRNSIKELKMEHLLLLKIPFSEPVFSTACSGVWTFPAAFRCCNRYSVSSGACRRLVDVYRQRNPRTTPAPVQDPAYTWRGTVYAT